MKKKIGNFYGSKIKTGTLHTKMHVKKGNKIPLAKVNASLMSVKRQLKTATGARRKALVKKERELVFAKNAKTKFNK